MPHTSPIQLSLVVPLFDEAESLPELVAWITRVVSPINLGYQIILVDDGSRDDSWAVIGRLKATYPAVCGIRFRRNYGKSAALNVGFTYARGDVVITLDADMQDSPDEIPELYHMVTAGGYDLVSGWKQVRHDPISKTIPSKLFNWATRKVTGIALHDFNCGLKAYRRQVVQGIEVYGEMHRYIPYLAKEAGFNRIGEKVVAHRARKYGRTKFGLERFVNGFLDLISLSFVLRFRRRPMHFFGLWGTLMFLAGFGITAWLIAEKVYWAWFATHTARPRDVTDQPLFYLALTTLVIGVQLFMAGFLGELVGRAASDRNQYLIEDKTD